MSKQKIKVKMVSSTCGITRVQSACVIGLGLRKIGQMKELEDTPSVRGMVKKVSHIVKIID